MEVFGIVIIILLMIGFGVGAIKYNDGDNT
jgi:hypothetical protein